MRLGSMTIEEVAQTVLAELLILVKAHHIPDDCRGGYLCAGKKDDGIPWLVMQIGEPLAQKARRYFDLCQEKPARARALRLGHMSSAKSRDPDKGQYRGGIIFEDTFLGFSGVPDDHIDEILMIHLGVGCGLLSPGGARALAAISDNPYSTNAP